ALPRVRGRPRLCSHHRRARVPDERPAEDLVADDADPEPGPAPGRGHECLLHHPGEGQVGLGRAVHGSPAAREAPGGAGRDRSRDRPPRRLVGLADVLFGRKKLKGPNEDSLFALTTACVTLQTELGLTPAGVGAVTYKSLSSGDFTRVD